MSVTLPLGVFTDSLVTMSTEVAIIIVTQLLIAGMGEEFGWRGFALQRLQHIMPPIKATLVIAFFHLLWHAPTYWLGQGMHNVPAIWATFFLLLALYVLRGGFGGLGTPPEFEHPIEER